MPAHPKHPHLPQGRAPGPQSERRKSGKRFGIVALGACAVACLVGAGLVFGGAFPENDDPGTTGLLVIGLAVFFALLALLISRLGRHRKELAHLVLSPGAPEYARGQTVKARLQVGDAAATADNTEVGLVCTEFYDAEISNGQGQTQRGTHEAVVWESWQRVDPARPIQEFAFTLPVDSPFSHEGDAISFGWRLSARERRRGRADPRTDEPFWVHP